MIPFIDLKSQFAQIEPEIRSAIDCVLMHGQFIMGPEVFEFEKQLAEYCGANHVVSCSSGTDALLMSLMAKGIGPGDAVITTPFTFFASVETICLTGATPVFADIDKKTFNIDANHLESVIKKILKEGRLKLKGIMPVDLFGQPADHDEIQYLADEYDLFVISDAAQSFGSTYKSKYTGNITEITTTSFFPAKPLGCYGDGGAIFTNDENIAQVLKSIRVHGQDNGDKYKNKRLGLAGRLDTLQAAILLEKLKLLKDEIVRRNQLADEYSGLLTDSVKVPFVHEFNVSAWAQYTVLVNDPQKVATTLNENNIPTARYYPIPMHLQEAVSYLGYKEGDYPAAEQVAKQVLSLPMHPNQELSTTKRICEIVNQSI